MSEYVFSSTPTFSEFDPTIIRYQDQVIDDVLTKYDYSLGIHEFLLSGAAGSAKSILLAHVAVRHLLENPGARGALVRRSMPDLKSTIFKKIVDHLDGSLIRDFHYGVNMTNASIKFRNGSELISRSWADRQYMKLRSLELSFAIVEEITENDEEDKQGYLELKMRVGRLPHIKQNWIGAACNPDSPSHWVYDYFELVKDEGLGGNSDMGLAPNRDRTPTKHVYYSITSDNPFLPKSYDEQLKRDLDPKLYERMGKGRWLEIKSDGIYHQYDRNVNYRDMEYIFDKKLPVILSWDFNIGEGKPLSVAVCQYDPDLDIMHIGTEVVVNGMRTEDSCEELAGRGILDLDVPEFYICGDASGRNKDTRNKRSDYDIINQYLSNHKTPDGKYILFQRKVPASNPAVRSRHNLVNSYLCNATGEHRMFVYKGAPVSDKGLRLTRLKDSGHYIEDDSKPYQHITTAIGYALHAMHILMQRGNQRTIQL